MQVNKRRVTGKKRRTDSKEEKSVWMQVSKNENHKQVCVSMTQQRSNRGREELETENR